jgi:hypothetical protein
MASYKIVPCAGGKFAVSIDEGKEPIVSGPYKTETAARAYISEHERLARAGERWAHTKLGKSAGRRLMAQKRLKRPRDPIQLGKLIVDIATGQVEEPKESTIAKRASTAVSK